MPETALGEEAPPGGVTFQRALWQNCYRAYQANGQVRRRHERDAPRQKLCTTISACCSSP